MTQPAEDAERRGIGRVLTRLARFVGLLALLAGLPGLPGCGDDKVPTTTAIVSYSDCACVSPSDNALCHTVTFWVTVAGQTELEDKPSGTIDFKDGANLLGTVALVSGEMTSAEFQLPFGTCQVAAWYGGDANFAGSRSEVTTLHLGYPTRITLTSYPNPSTLGQSVGFTAAVTPIVGTGVPSGTITIVEVRQGWRQGWENTGTFHVVATVALESGRAEYITSTLSAGAHLFYAQYSGSADFHVSTSISHSNLGAPEYLMHTVS